MINQLTANPAPLGLLGFGMTTVLLNIHNAGFFSINPMIIAMGIFYGGIAQVIAGVLEWKKNNTFGTTVFTSYGLFWLSFAALNLLPMMGLGEPTSPEAMAAYLFMWGLFTLVLFNGGTGAAKSWKNAMKTSNCRLKTLLRNIIKSKSLFSHLYREKSDFI